jgi:hypothetical protein
MSSRFEPQLPEILPTEEVRVEDEGFIFTTYEDSSGSIIEKTEYLLEKAPIQRIESVSGILDDGAIEFEQGVDYELSHDQEELAWLDGGDHPDPGSTFYVTYRSESIMGRYIRSHTDELDEVEQDLERLIEAKFVDKAEGQELDRIGDIFGTLGRRLGRDDDEYRIYLKSIVQSFVSRGTKNDIKTALSAATDVPLEDIQINEDFENTEYEVNILAATPITGSLVEVVSEIADPSGVEQSRTRLTIPADEVAINDSADFSFGTPVDGGSLGSTDATNVVPPAARTTDTTGSNETVAISQTTVSWDKGSWESMNWA